MKVSYYVAPALRESFKRKPETIIDRLCDHYNVSQQQLLSKSRDRQLVFIRHLAIYLILTKTKTTLKATGEIFGRDHTTAMHAKKAIEDYLDTNSFNKREEIEQFINSL
jgi:chromosomal replication initiator protein